MTKRIQSHDSHPSRPAGSETPRARLLARAIDPIEVGAGTALVLEGELESGGSPPASLRVRLGGIESEVDLLGTAADGSALRWSALVPIPAGTPAGATPLALIAGRGGGEVQSPLGEVALEHGGADPGVYDDRIRATGDRIRATRDGPAAEASDAAPAVAPAPGDRRPLIAICMATHEAPADRLRRQLDSIRAQGWERWICLISDDASSPEVFAELERAVAGDTRFIVSRSERRLGFLRNFERALRMIPPEAELVALADQDDRWYPDKLEALAATLAEHPRAALAYSDMRITDVAGRVLSDTFWYLRRNRCDDLASLLVANVVTGAASLFRRALLDDALPFPPAHPGHALYHDQWLALCALAAGEVAYLDRPTYDYCRHDESVTVLEAPRWLRPQPGRAGRLRLHWGRLTRRLRMGSEAPPWESIYRDRWLLIRQLACVLELRLGERIEPAKRRSLRGLVAAERSPLAAIWLLGRCLRPLIGRNETLARERVLLGGLLWRWTRGRGRR